MNQRKPFRQWTEQDIKNMLAKKSIVPPPDRDYTPRWYWPVAISVVLTMMFVGFYYGVYVR